jgi:hypothetical protein
LSKNILNKWSLTADLYNICFLAELPKPPNLEDYGKRALLKRTGSLTFLNFKKIRIVAEVQQHSGFGWNSLRTYE